MLGGKLYTINYQTKISQNNNIDKNLITQINIIYSDIKEIYSHDDIVILTGTYALFYYLYKLKYYDLIERLDDIGDLTFLLQTDKNTSIQIPFIGEYKNQDITNKNQMVKFENTWSKYITVRLFYLIVDHNINDFYEIKKIKLIHINKLKNEFINDKNKLDIIIEMINRIQKVTLKL